MVTLASTEPSADVATQLLISTFSTPPCFKDSILPTQLKRALMKLKTLAGGTASGYQDGMDQLLPMLKADIFTKIFLRASILLWLTTRPGTSAMVLPETCGLLLLV